MRRLIALIGLALVIVAVSSASALACVVPVGSPSVSAPNGQSGNGQGTFRCLPDNKGTQKAATATPSPAVNLECSNNQ